MKNKLARCLSALSLVLVLAGCAITPRVSVWNAPNRLTARDVFSAGLQAGQSQGMQLSASDRESGTMSFRRKVGNDEMILTATVKQVGDRVQVQTTAAVGGGLPIRGLHEEFINNFHVYLFRNLGITDGAERKVDVQQMK